MSETIVTLPDGSKIPRAELIRKVMGGQIKAKFRPDGVVEFLDGSSVGSDGKTYGPNEQPPAHSCDGSRRDSDPQE